MGSLDLRQRFDPFDLEAIDRVYGVACAYIEARDLYRDTEEKDAKEQDALRKIVFACANTGTLDFDTLCDRVLVSMDEYRKTSRVPDPHAINVEEADR
jgi:hypothetical protein